VSKIPHVPAGKNLQSSQKFSNFTYFKGPVSPEGSGLSNTPVCRARPLDSPRNLFQKLAEKPKIQIEKVARENLI
jgi:hypothetical protein